MARGYQYNRNKAEWTPRARTKAEPPPIPSPRYRIEVVAVEADWVRHAAGYDYTAYWLELGRVRCNTALEKVRASEDGGRTWFEVPVANMRK